MPTNMTCISHSPAETAALARRLAAALKPGDCLAVTGELGSGKTVFAAALKDVLGAVGEMQSPTFTMLRSYDAGEGGLAFHHFDAYRLSGADEWFDLGFADIVEGDGISLVEWAELVADALPKRSLWMQIERSGDNETTRHIEFTFPEGDARADLKF